MSENISKAKREKLIEEIEEIKGYIASAPQDENTARLLSYIANIEKDIRSKKYGLIFEEHREQIDEILENNAPVFTENSELFIDNGGQMNFLLEGDNLASLKLLEKTHKGKIDIIYIDPPYNTGNKDFVYDDAFVNVNDTFRHSKWLSFMEKRLKIAKRLLSDSGVIFISIDDNEQAQLKLLCDTVFGEDCFLASFCWMKTSTPPSLSKTVRKKLEAVLCYKKSVLANPLYGGFTDGGDMPLLNEGNRVIPVTVKKEALVLKIPDGLYTAGKYDRVELLEDFTVKDGKALNDLKLCGPMKWTQATIDKETQKGTTYYIKSTKFAIRYSRTGKRIKLPSNLISSAECDVETNEEAAKELISIFGEKPFSYPKPVSLIKYLVNMQAFYNPNAVILDFFAGSGTTGHAVMKLNAEDGGNRRFILCTNNENNICRDVTYERIKRVIEKEEYKASLKYFKVDYVPISEKFYYEYADELLLHVRELVELENGINFESNNEIAILLTGEELDEFVLNAPASCKTVYLGHDALPNAERLHLFEDKNIEVNIIPEYYCNDFE